MHMKLGPVTKLGKRNTGTWKKTWRHSKKSYFLSTNNDFIVSSRFVANLEQSGNRVLEAWFADITKIKGNSQFIFLWNPQKSGASRVCITFLQITQKILTKDIFHWLELITEILSFLQIFSVRKTTTQLL